jgi:hypothetical protein
MAVQFPSIWGFFPLPYSRKAIQKIRLLPGRIFLWGCPGKGLTKPIAGEPIPKIKELIVFTTSYEPAGGGVPLLSNLGRRYFL